MHFPIPSTIFEHGRAWTAPHFVVWSPLVSRVGSGRAGGALAPGCPLRAGMEFMCAIFGCRKPKADEDGEYSEGTDVARAVRDVPALFAVNDFSDLDRGIPKLSGLTAAVYEAYRGGEKKLVRYNSPLRLALRGTLDAMSSKFLNKAFVFLQGLDGFEPVPKAGTHATAPNVDKGLLDLDDAAKAGAMPRWVVTTRPWAQTEAEKTIDDYESAQIVFDQAGSNGS